MLTVVVIVLLYLTLPAGILYLCKKIPVLNKIGAIVLAYIIGLIAGNSGILPEEFQQVQEELTTITIPLALPLLLFSANVKSWLGMARTTFLSMILGVAGLIIMVITGFFIFGNEMDETWKIAGMLVGVYTGGTPNLASIQTALEVDNAVYIITHTYDMVLSAVFLLFVISVGQRFIGFFLRPFPKEMKTTNVQDPLTAGNTGYENIFSKPILKPLLIAFLAAVIIFAIGGLSSMLVPESFSTMTAILVITTLGIAASLIPNLNQAEKTFEAGMYFILIFSIAVASMADIKSFQHMAPQLFYYISYVLFGTLILHIGLSKLFKVDTDTLLVTSTALICSPPFVPMVAGALKNRQVVLSGLSIGIIGYAVGNYLGIAIAYLLK